MGRHKKEIKMDVDFRIRIEPEFKKEYFLLCKKMKTTPSKEIRKFVLDKINEL